MTDQSNIKILGCKIQKEGAKLVLNLKESSTVRSVDQKTCEDHVHDDLVTAMDALKPHLAVLCDFIEPKQIADYDADKFKVNGYSIGGNDGEEGITIMGMRKTKSGMWYSINTPFMRFGSDDTKNRYQLMEDLLNKVAGIETEVEEYLFNGKMKAPKLINEKSNGKVTHLQVVPPLTGQEIFNEGMANPAAMERVSEITTNGDAVAIGELVKEQREQLTKGKRKTK